MNSEKISVIIPCFNEEAAIRQNIRKIHQYLSENFVFFEIIAVNDGSTDKTMLELEKITREIPLKIINHPKNSGKGKAVRNGLAESKNELVMFLDADLAIPIEELAKFVAEIKNGNDIVIASRFIPGLKILKPVLWYRKFMEKVFRLLRMLILNNFDIRDTQCGFKVFRREAVNKIAPLLTVDRFAFDAEIIFVAKKIGLKIKEVPISLQNPAESHVRILRDPLNMIVSLIKIRLNSLAGKYR